MLSYTSLDMCSRVVHQGDETGLFFIFWGTFMLIFAVVAPVYIPTNSGREFPFPHILASICFLKIAVLTG
jgi:hypothetical protein